MSKKLLGIFREESEENLESESKMLTVVTTGKR